MLASGPPRITGPPSSADFLTSFFRRRVVTLDGVTAPFPLHQLRAEVSLSFALFQANTLLVQYIRGIAKAIIVPPHGLGRHLQRYGEIPFSIAFFVDSVAFRISTSHFLSRC